MTLSVAYDLPMKMPEGKKGGKPKRGKGEEWMFGQFSAFADRDREKKEGGEGRGKKSQGEIGAPVSLKRQFCQRDMEKEKKRGGKKD